MADLFDAAVKGDLAVLESAKADLSLVLDSNGASLLQWASHANQREVVKFLIAKGLAVNHQCVAIQSTALHWAARSNSLKAAFELLNSKDLQLQLLDSEGMAPIHLAVAFGHHLMVELLIAHGADINIRDGKYLRTPLGWACSVSLVPTATTQVLLRLGADVNLGDSQGRQPLHWAVYVTKWDDAIALLSVGASVTSRDHEQKRPLDLFDQPSTWISAWMIQALGGPRDVYRLSWSKPFRSLVLLSTHFCLLCELLATLSYVSFPTAVFVWLFCVGAHAFLVLRLWPVARLDQHNLFVAGIYIGTYFVCVGSFFVDNDLRRFWLENYPMVSLVVWPAVVALLWLLAKIRFSDPGFLPKATSAEAKKTLLLLASQDLLNESNYCWSCGIRRPLRSKHDTVTNQCIARFDHFCLYTDCAVAARNHRYFIMWLALSLACQAALGYCVFQYAMPPATSEDSSWLNFFIRLHVAAQLHPWQIGQTFASFVAGVCQSWLLFTQLYMNCWCNLTSNELSNLWRYDYLWTTDSQTNHQSVPWLVKLLTYLSKGSRHQERYRNVFDQGVVSNTLDFWLGRTNWATLFVPPLLPDHKKSN